MKISVITINFNDIKGLEKTFESVVNQSFKDFEYVVIDGGSTDGSKTFLEQNSDKISYWISEKDSGIYNAMNKGIKVATGEYLLFLNSGDCFANHNVLQSAVPFLESQESIIYGKMLLSKNGKIMSELLPPAQLDFSYIIKNSLPHPASFIKRELFAKYFLYNEKLKIVSDWEFFIYLICKQNESYKFIDLTISDFDNDGISSQEGSKNEILLEEDQVFQNYFPMFLSEVKWIRKVGSKRLNQLHFIAEKKFRWKIIKGLMSLFLCSKKVDFTKPIFNKLS